MESFSVGIHVRDWYYVVILGTGELRDLEQKNVNSAVVNFLQTMTNFQAVPYDSQLMPVVEVMYKLPYQPAEIVDKNVRKELFAVDTYLIFTNLINVERTTQVKFKCNRMQPKVFVFLAHNHQLRKTARWIVLTQT